MIGMECPQGSREANLTRAGGNEEKLNEIIRMGNIIEISNEHFQWRLNF